MTSESSCGLGLWGSGAEGFRVLCFRVLGCGFGLSGLGFSVGVQLGLGGQQQVWFQKKYYGH